MRLLWTASIAIALFAAIVVIHNRRLVAQPRTRWDSDTIEDTLDHTGCRHTLERGLDAQGVSTLTLHTLARPTAAAGYLNKPASPPLHKHMNQDEYFTVKAGVMGFLNDGTEGELHAGQPPLHVLPGVSHTFWNARNDSNLAVDILVSPAGTMEGFFRSLFGLNRDHGGLDKVHPLQLLATFGAGDVVFANVPRWCSDLLNRVLLPDFIIPVLGFQPFPPEYAAAAKGDEQ